MLLVRAALLKIGKDCIEDQQRRDDSSFVKLVECDLKRYGSLKQPWNRRPEFGECIDCLPAE
jgi:hypothetical protein